MDQDLVIAIKKLITKAGRIALEARENGINVEWKEDNSPVTDADKAISQYIFDGLFKLTPEIPIICEERPLVSIDKDKQFWLVDPIDGTRSFISYKDSFTVNIALVDNRKAVYGFVYQPTKGMLYFTDGNKQFCIEQNGKPLAKKVHNQDGFVAIVSSNNFNSMTSNYLKSNNFVEVISVPSSLKLCLIAEGVGDVYPKFGTTMEWDIAAGHALIIAAGGDIYLPSGELMLYAKENFQNPHFIAANKKWLKDLAT
ncbi:MAG: 3'(2'),5'-bisphosphate nucleotidase CysQ [Rickettsiaceae bacterium]|nr:3'(2'),5'-bisphosphate nucleotidase CysQ [Rickettsiaceae bacterium]MDP5021340.1 3'(2'),5'-bisphosphate nucleotidase CysQ [Rickettsiaceae bacterium]